MQARGRAAALHASVFDVCYVLARHLLAPLSDSAGRSEVAAAAKTARGVIKHAAT